MKYTDNFFSNTNVLQYAKIGLEFEFYVRNISYYKLLEISNQYFDNVKIIGFKEYHPDFVPTETEWIITPDLSGGNNMVELVTGAMPYFQAKLYIVKIMKFLQDFGYTTDKCAIHYNISFLDIADKSLDDLNILKLILLTDEDEIYKDFPMRKNNVYAKSVKSIIPYKDFDFNDVPVSVVANRLKLPDDKYYGINFSHIRNTKDTQRLEYRYIGGKDYEKDYSKIIKYLDKFIINTYNSIDMGFSDLEVDALDTYLNHNINKYQNINTYDGFLGSFPKATVMVNQNTSYDLVNNTYPLFYDTLYNFLEVVDGLDECIINYVTESQRLEIVETEIVAKGIIKNIDFHNCVLKNSVIEKSIIGMSELINCQIQKSSIYDSDVKKSKIISCKTFTSDLEDCYFVNSLLDSYLYGVNSIFRSGEIGENGEVAKEVKIITPSDNFFNTRFEDDVDLDDEDGIIINKLNKK